jgi:hypothetical protein
MFGESVSEIVLLLEFLLDVGNVRTLGFLVLDLLLAVMALFHASEHFRSHKKNFRNMPRQESIADSRNSRLD